MESFIEILKAIIFGIVEGITEWLPISSTGHLILLNEIMPLNVSDEFLELFEVVIQLGAIMAVVILFFNKLWPFKFKKEENDTMIKKDVLAIWIKVLIACIPAAIVGLLLDDWINDNFFNYVTVSITLILYGVIFIIVELLNRNKEFKTNDVIDISYNTALLIGLIQLLSLIPGTSRSGVTILGAMILGCSRTASAEFSFYLSIPIMFGASILKGGKFFLDNGMPSSNEIAILLVGMIISFVVSLACIKGLMKFIKKHDFKIFGIYRIILGIIIIIFFSLR